MNYRFLEANPAFERQTGVNLRGKWVTEFAADLDRFWFETYGHLARTGEPASFETYAEGFDRWFDVRAMRIGEPAEHQIALPFEGETIILGDPGRIGVERFTAPRGTMPTQSSASPPLESLRCAARHASRLCSSPSEALAAIPPRIRLHAPRCAG